MKSKSLLAAAVTIMIICGCNKATLTVSDLKCENLRSPLGIGTTTPSFSWKISSDKNGTTRNAFQLLAASRPDLLEEGKADLWNSGKVVSSDIYVPYKGSTLGSGSLCYWKVRVWDEKESVSEWSNTEFFSVGLLEKSDWQAVYIGLPGDDNKYACPQLRKSFEIKDIAEKVMLHVNSLGYHEIYVNGKKAGDKVLTPAVSQYDKRSHILTYDITPLLNQGRNDIIIWLGHGWYRNRMPGVIHDRPVVRAQAEQLPGNERIPLFRTDSTWTGRSSGYYSIGTWNSHDFGGEKVESGQLLPDLTAASLDGVDWKAVMVYGDTGYEATPQTTESNRIREEIVADTIIPFGERTWLADMGTTLTGYAEIRFHDLKEGEEVVMEYADHLEKDGKLKDQGQTDRFTGAGKEEEIFRNIFNYHGFRYIKISNIDKPPLKDDVKGYLVHTDYSLSSTFECSDPDLNRIHNMIFRTLRCLSLGGDLVDCPQIERLGYGGDGNASTLTAQTMFDLAPLYSNWLQAWADCIREDGGMPHTAPNPYPAGGGPYWCGFIITATWNTYVNYGDARLLEKYYPVMQKWLGYVEKYSPSGLLEQWPDTDYRGWYLGDWAVPEGIDQKDMRSVNLVNNCFISVCFSTMEKIANTLGKKGDARLYNNKNDQIRKLINERLYDPEQGIYGSGSQIDLTYPLLAGVVQDSAVAIIRKKITDVIEIDHNGHIACGLVGIPVFTEWAVKNRESNLMYSILKKKDYPGYLYMLENGATTTWEHWNGARSRIHNCYNGIGSWFYQAVAGIQPDETSAGYRHFIIDPQIPDGVTWVNATKETPFGQVSVRWKTDENKFEMDMKIPVGSTARLVLPKGSQNVMLNGKSIGGEEPILEIPGGEYSFSCNRAL